MLSVQAANSSHTVVRRSSTLSNLARVESSSEDVLLAVNSSTESGETCAEHDLTQQGHHTSTAWQDHNTTEFHEYTDDLEEDDIGSKSNEICEDDCYDYSPIEDNPDPNDSVGQSDQPMFENRLLLEHLQERRVLQAIKVFVAERCMERMRISSPVSDRPAKEDADDDELFRELFEGPINITHSASTALSDQYGETSCPPDVDMTDS